VDSVSNSLGTSLHVQVWVQTEPLPNWRSGLSTTPNRQLRYSSMVNSLPVWIGRVVSGSLSRSIHRFNQGSCLWSMSIVSYQHRVFNNRGYVLHALQLSIPINLESVFYISSIVFLPIRAVNNSVMNVKICAMPWLPNMQQLKLLTLHSC